MAQSKKAQAKKAPSTKAPSRKARTKGPRPGRVGAAGASSSPGAALMDLKAVATARQVFWSNVLREIMTSLCMASLREQAAQDRTPRALGEADTQAAPGEDVSKIFDGRLAVITSWGLRLSIAAIEPVLGAAPSGGRTALQQALECSVFQIRTTDGDVWTLPLHEIRAFHALTEELMEELARAAGSEEQDQTDSQPFGFKAYTSLSRLDNHPAAELQQPDYLGE